MSLLESGEHNMALVLCDENVLLEILFLFILEIEFFLKKVNGKKNVFLFGKL